MKQAGDVADDPYFRKLAWQSVIMLLLGAAGIALLGFFLHQPVTAAATKAVEILGVPGIFIGVFASDALGFPVPPSTYLFAAVAADSPMVILLTTMALASILGATVAYHIGPYIARLPLLRTLLDRFRPRGEELVERWGVWAVGVAAITPLPFPVICWLAGIYRMPFRRFFPTTLLRAPRMVIYYAFFALGWASAVGAA